MPAPKKPLPKFEDYKAPWEVNSDGSDVPEDEQEVDTVSLKKYLHNLLSDKDRLQGTIVTLTSERDEAQEKVKEIERKDESELDRIKRENAELQKKIDEKPPGDDVEKLRLEAALEAGLPRKHIGRLNRDLTTLDELIEDANELKASFGGNSDTPDDTETPRGRARQVRTSGDPKGGSSKKEVTVDDVLSAVPSGGGF